MSIVPPSITCLTVSGFLLGLVVDSIPSQRPTEVPVTVACMVGQLADGERVPFALRRYVTDGKLRLFDDHAIAVAVDQDSIRLDLDGDGSFERTVLKRAGLVSGASGTSTLVAFDGATWFAAPATTWSAAWRKHTIVILDGRGDGKFNGDAKWVRLNEGCFHRLLPEQPWVAAKDVLAAIEFDDAGDRPALRVSTLGQASGQDSVAWKSLMTLNAIRAHSGLPPTRLDKYRCLCCKKHADYLVRNALKPDDDSVNWHDELPHLPGFSQEGKIGAQNNVSFGSNASNAIVECFGTLAHRVDLIGPATDGFGVGVSGKFVVSGMEWPSVSTIEAIICVPAPGQVGIPWDIHAEWPEPDGAPGYYSMPRGYPVLVHFGSAPVSDSKIRLFDAGGKEVTGRCFSPERPMSRLFPDNFRSAMFAADYSLSANATFHVEFTCKTGGRDLCWRWSFQTARRER